MNVSEPVNFIRQHLIDPEVCIRCNTCEETCPVDAITHDSRNYVVNADKCNSCMACISPCPTGSIDHWRTVAESELYSVEAQFGWDELPVQAMLPEMVEPGTVITQPDVQSQLNAATSATSSNAPWSAAHPYLNLYSISTPAVATVAGNYRLTGAQAQSDVHHIVLDFGSHFFPVLEGQSIGIMPPGLDVNGKPHYLRMYSVASPRDGERDGYNNLALTVKRVTENHEGQKVRGVCSNFLCDLKKGDTVQVTGPFGANYLMPNHAGANLLMICTGTGSAPMRAMTERRRRQLVSGKASDGKIMLFFGARNPEELPYFGPLLKLPPTFVDKHFAFSRVPDQPRTYVQDKLRAAEAAVSELLRADTYVYVCGLKGMETGVMQALQDICDENGIDWPVLHADMVKQGRFHVETY